MELFSLFLATAVHCAPTASTTTTSSSSHFSRIVKGRNLIISEKSSVKKNRPNKWKIHEGLRGLISQKKLRQFKLYLVIFCDFFLSSINQYFCLEILSEKVSKFSKKCKKKIGRGFYLILVTNTIEDRTEQWRKQNVGFGCDTPRLRIKHFCLSFCPGKRFKIYYISCNIFLFIRWHTTTRHY